LGDPPPLDIALYSTHDPQSQCVITYNV
jgi:hypothetical protein